MNKVKILFLIVTFVALFAVAAYAQFDAGFLDGPHYNGGNVTGYTDTGWYCLGPNGQHYNFQTHTWIQDWVVVSGSWSTEPNCNAG